MQLRLKAPVGTPVRVVSVVTFLLCFAPAHAQVYLTPTDVVAPENASQLALDQSASRPSLRVAGLDIFPHASGTVLYDDNLFINHSNQLSDVEWTLSPGLTVAAGDVSTYLPGSVTLAQLRNLQDYSVVEDNARPQRFLGLDYTPSINWFTHHSTYNNVDHRAGLSAGYAFSRLTLGLDQDYSHIADKDNQVGSRVIHDRYDTRLKTRYEVTDRSNFEVNGTYTRLEYAHSTYEGYQEFRNDDWYNRQIGAKTEAAVGLVFGFLYPDVQANQTYQQLLVRGTYRLTGKMNIRLAAGAEYRQYDTERANTVDPVVSVTAIYLPTENTTFTLDAHRMDWPSPYGDFNYVVLGVYAGAQQRLFRNWSVQLAGGYDHTDYVSLQSDTGNTRSDGYFSFQASLNYEMNRHLNATLFYYRRQNDSNQQLFSYGNNLAGFQVVWTY